MNDIDYLWDKWKQTEKERDEWKDRCSIVGETLDGYVRQTVRLQRENEKLKNIIMNHVYKHGCEMGVDLEDDGNPWKAMAERLEKEYNELYDSYKALSKSYANVTGSCGEASE